MIQSNPPRAEARRTARADTLAARPLRDYNDRGPSRAQRRHPAAPIAGELAPNANRDNAPRRAARIQQRRRAAR